MTSLENYFRQRRRSTENKDVDDDDQRLKETNDAQQPSGGEEQAPAAEASSSSSPCRREVTDEKNRLDDCRPRCVLLCRCRRHRVERLNSLCFYSDFSVEGRSKGRPPTESLVRRRRRRGGRRSAEKGSCCRVFLSQDGG